MKLLNVNSNETSRPYHQGETNKKKLEYKSNNKTKTRFRYTNNENKNTQYCLSLKKNHQLRKLTGGGLKYCCRAEPVLLASGDSSCSGSNYSTATGYNRQDTDVKFGDNNYSDGSGSSNDGGN